MRVSLLYFQALCNMGKSILAVWWIAQRMSPILTFSHLAMGHPTLKFTQQALSL